MRDAVVEIDARDEPNFAVIRAVLENHHPEVIGFLFDDLTPKQGAVALPAADPRDPGARP